jgi:hypothetical protein
VVNEWWLSETRYRSDDLFILAVKLSFAEELDRVRAEQRAEDRKTVEETMDSCLWEEKGCAFNILSRATRRLLDALGETVDK